MSNGFINQIREGSEAPRTPLTKEMLAEAMQAIYDMAPPEPFLYIRPRVYWRIRMLDANLPRKMKKAVRTGYVPKRYREMFRRQIEALESGNVTGIRWI